MNLKTFCCTLITLIPFFLFSQTLTKITIKLDGFDPDSNKLFAELTIPSIFETDVVQLRVDDEGVCQTFLNIPSECEIIFSYRNRKLPLMLAPSDSIWIKLDLENFLDWEVPYTGDVLGNNEKTNALILKHYRRITQWISQSTDAFKADKSMPESQYKIKRLGEMNNHLDSLSSFIANESISDEGFIDCAKSWIIYKAGQDLALFPFMGRLNRDINEDSTYFTFLNEIPINADTPILYNEYLTYLQNSTGAFMIIANISHKYEARRDELTTSDFQGSLPLSYELLSALPEGRERELIMIITTQFV